MAGPVVRLNPVPPQRLPAADAATRDFDLMFTRLAAALGDDFGAARQLLALLERAAGRLGELDRRQLGRLMVSAGHEIGLSCRRNDRG